MSIPHRPYIDPTSIQHRPYQPYIDPTSSPHRPHTQLLCQHSSVNSEVIYHHHLHISIVFPPPRPHNSCHRVSSLRETRMFLRLLCFEQWNALKFLLGEIVYKYDKEKRRSNEKRSVHDDLKNAQPSTTPRTDKQYEVRLSFSLSVYCKKRIDFMLTWVFSVIDNRQRQNLEKKI